MRLSVGAQLTAAMWALVLLLIAPAAAGLDLLIQGHYDDLRRESGRAEAADVEATVLELRARLADRVDLLVTHPDLGTMIDAHQGRDATPPADSMWATDRLEEMRRQLGLDALTLVDAAGHRVAECSEGDKVHELLADRALRDARDGVPSQDVVRQDSSFRLRATRPIVRDGVSLGALMGGYLLDRDDLEEIRRGTGFHAALTFEGEVLEATLEAFDRVPTASVYEIKRELAAAEGTHPSGRNGHTQHAVELDGQPYDVVLSPLPVGGDADLVGAVVLLTSAAEVDEARGYARRMAGAMVAAGLLLAALLASAFSLGLTRPLRRLVAVARDLREGRLDRRSGLDRGDELGELSQAFDEMAASLEQNLAETQRLAVTDELTGLANRRKFGEELARELERSRRFGLELGLLILDIDHFKRINDTRGHPVGDEVLAGIAAAIGMSLRNIDLACRYGGEEFALLLPATPGQDAVVVAERVRSAVADRPLGPDGDIHVTLSAGVAAYPDDGETAGELIRIADMRLYAAKQGGRNRVIGPRS